ncbi:glycosyltransferase [Prauserella marina]|uniref:Glyoxalase/Bleomycin resistance protein/Dioxygenase superfamily protein n=1 Tax=Prauserella marina TaxID=530584 RepID=A0A222VXZ2_9PSEU|nr:VOC family protein [Prauserella marina]ASR38846.1 glycosyltransferase [Prauserella marina]PWV82376.1 glyoxalase/bleomycin resistance protein/dioxygenase superfamily protein [Prauserella marina]SDC67672.1 Glyoxalase/Bleomycin resistance protein/Dioxygenase superfamily protein [Prauserella marina]
MTETFSAFSISPVPVPGPGTEPAELFRGIYGMPTFVTVPTADLAASVDFWTRGLGFFDLFSVEGAITHLRRWAFQDVLLVPGEPAEGTPALSVTFSCVLKQIDEIKAACERLAPGSTRGPETKPWNSVELEVRTPDNTRVIMSAAQPYDPDSPEAANLRDMGIEGPGR